MVLPYQQGEETVQGGDGRLHTAAVESREASGMVFGVLASLSKERLEVRPRHHGATCHHLRCRLGHPEPSTRSPPATSRTILLAISITLYYHMVPLHFVHKGL